MTNSWPSWALAAEDRDESELALALFGGLPAELADESVAVSRAALLLRVGQPAQAVAVLAEHGYTKLPEVNRAAWPDLVLAAGSAAVGDQAAYRWLMACVRRFQDASDAWRLNYLVAAAATGVHDRPTADQAWHTLVAQYGIVTPVTAAEFGAVVVAGRDPRDVRAATVAVATAVTGLHDIGVPIEQNPEPTLRAARALQARGDVAGARLLLHVVRRRIPHNAALDGAQAKLTPVAAMRRHRLLVVVLWCLAPTLLPLGVAGGLIVLAVSRAWQRWVPIPGLSRPDSSVWRAFRGLSYDPYSDPRDPPPKDQAGYYGLAALLSLLFVALPLAAPTTALVNALTGGGDATDAGRPIVVGTWLLLCIGIPGLVFLIARQAHRQMRARQHRRDRQAAQRARLSQAKRCHCWQVRSISGEFAVEYERQHLHPEASPPLPVALPGTAGLGRCPTTGALWLTLDADDAGKALLLRGTTPPENESKPEPGGLYI
ncbi:hypothetical protein [Actinoplanes siamensis]|uniref:hypothetical protein n=1 Tax=Actinoplanes siamensis TaxID=1223317 RepID=UPI001945007C|nr:hypothetical protein [Actinoplanes siamensis]